MYSTIPELLKNKKKIDEISAQNSPAPKQLNTAGNIWYLGSNSYDHHNVEILKTLKKQTTLIFFDAHSDDRVSSEKLDCGNWINWALKNPNILRVVWIGGSQGLLKEAQPWGNYEHIQAGKMVIFPARNFVTYFKGALSPTHKFVKRVSYDSIGGFFGFPGYSIDWYNFSEALKTQKLEESIASRDIYISIDLDVLKEEFGKTPWGNGLFTDAELKDILDELYKNYNVTGVNICGPEKCLSWLVPHIIKMSRRL
ncbi:hypothetical protein KJ633_01470 [bacterium]|nr:hypothetical protein [bacterium]MBU3955108.1 hypothetical protein [bacterium]MBU4133776.1 hypothetical protein [bacterium]